MKYVGITQEYGGNYLNPEPYLERLGSFAEELPCGAREFATDPGHYDFAGKRCVKDLKLSRILFDEPGITVEFRHNCWKHDDDLTIQYAGVHEFKVDLPAGGLFVPWHRDVVLDEILPAEAGCSHEIACQAGSVHILCQDLVATWTVADCAEK